jgi:hypothetical protein
MKTTATSKLCGLVLGGLLVAAPTLARADADAPMSAQQADKAAEAAEQQAAQAKELGGVGYKTGEVQRDEAAAARYSSTGTEAQAPAPVTSPEAQHYAELAEQYKQLGGVGYKTGLVQRAEADGRRAQERADQAAAQPVTAPAGRQTYPGACNADDPWMQPLDCWK